ncbi:sodium:sulfate symporter [Pseudodesulfovibrio cashew]|uniref:Sodium:sulfate symporter n=1 Tax=Pseudodesulfovibrio cashew TaxID=2678688 RepID=A0A6I6J8B2_9BACT|nr:SLC13 family permease [Pseudodesulfovibrio cashew]QGY39066.1 sodium:sulfate symporter [Pseudodesulfovibrio cashew]
MELNGDILGYLWQRLPLLLLFGGGYLVYQIMAVTRLTDAFVCWALRKSGGRPALLLLYVIGTAAALSSFIPNAITVLTMLPLLKRLDNTFRENGGRGMTTVLMCAAIYGAAIGGFGSMIGSPANAILFGALDLFEVAGREQITFFNWFLWSLPLAAMLVLVAWGVAAGLGLPASARGKAVHLECLTGGGGTTGRQRYAGTLFWVYMGFWILEAVAQEAIPGFALLAPWVCVAFTVLFLFFVFIRRAPTSPAGIGPLLRPIDLLSSLPRRGFIFLLGLAVLIGLAQWLGMDKRLAVLAHETLQSDMPGLALFFLLVLAVIFLTEVLSNTTVVAAFYPIAYYAAQGHGMDPLPLMVGISLASTCAFMTPVATPTSALAFGEMRGASLRIMLGLGVVLNLAAAVLITGWLAWILPRVY